MLSREVLHNQKKKMKPLVKTRVGHGKDDLGVDFVDLKLWLCEFRCRVSCLDQPLQNGKEYVQVKCDSDSDTDLIKLWYLVSLPTLSYMRRCRRVGRADKLEFIYIYTHTSQTRSNKMHTFVLEILTSTGRV